MPRQDHTTNQRPLRDRLTVSETDTGQVVIDWAEPGCVTTRLLSAHDARLMGGWLLKAVARAERSQAGAPSETATA